MTEKITIEKKVYDVLTKNNLDMMEQIKTQEKHIKSLIHKLESVRKARKRDKEEFEDKIQQILNSFKDIEDYLVDKRLKAKLEHFIYLYFGIQEVLAESGKVSADEMLEIIETLDEKYKEMFDKYGMNFFQKKSCK